MWKLGFRVTLSLFCPVGERVRAKAWKMNERPSSALLTWLEQKSWLDGNHFRDTYTESLIIKAIKTEKGAGAKE